MNIAINALGPSKIKLGIGNYAVHLVRELSKIDKENNYLILANQDNAHFFNVKNHRFQTYLAPAYTRIKLLRILWERFGLPSILTKKNIELFHGLGFVLPKLHGLTSVVTIHDMTFFSHPEYHTRSKVSYFKTMIPQSILHADVVIADSDNTKKDIITYLGTNPQKITTIHLGVSEKFKPGDKKKSQLTLRKKYGIRNKFILFVGMIEPRKNLTRLVEAFLHVKQPELKLVIVGQKGWGMDDFFTMIARLQLTDVVYFPGYIPDDDLILFYQAAELFVYPSVYEGFGIPVIEAMASGCPVITSNTSSLKEIAGTAAVLVSPIHTKKLAETITRVLRDDLLKSQLIARGLARVRQFTWKKTAEKTLALYKSI